MFWRKKANIPAKDEILYSGPSFKVILKPSLELFWEIGSDQKISEEAHSLLARAKVMDVLPIPKLGAGHIRAWKLTIGHAVSLALLDKLEDAKETLDKGEKYISSRAQEASKRWYVQAVFWVLLPVLLIASVIHISTNHQENKPEVEDQREMLLDLLNKAGEEYSLVKARRDIAISEATKDKSEAEKLGNQDGINKADSELSRVAKEHEEIVNKARQKVDDFQKKISNIDLRKTMFESLETFELAIYIIFGGILGAAFSLLSRIGKIQVDPSSGKMAHFVDVYYRFLVGVLAATVVVIATKANLVLGFATATSSESQVSMLLILAIAAGASERLAPNVLKQVESTALQSDESTSNKGEEAMAAAKEAAAKKTAAKKTAAKKTAAKKAARNNE